VGERDLNRDWMLTHEMVHLALPNLDYRHRWLEEGIATYVEPIARARKGALAAEEVWRGFMEGMPQGLPGEGDRGLDRTHTWGRTYWGGALFCLLADVAIRERTQGERSLDDALKAVLAAGGSISTRWSLEQTLDAADRGVGAPVLRELYARLGSRPTSPDLDRLWKRLGLVVRAGRVDFDEDAPLAALRRAITRGPTPRP
jgi:predicted metalloprotease with PDZ domain